MSVPAIGLVSTGQRASRQRRSAFGARRALGAAAARLHPGRLAGSTGGQQPQMQVHSIRDQQPRAAQQHSWLQRLRSCGGPQKPFVLFVEREFILLEFSVCSVELV